MVVFLFAMPRIGIPIMDRTQYRRKMLEQHAEQVKQLLERFNEQQRRHVGGLLALLLGRGGDVTVNFPFRQKSLFSLS